MGKIKGREAIKNYVKKYSSSGVDFFQLKNDGDTAKVRMLHEDDQDLEIMLVHEVEIDGKRKKVECLEEDCPFCEEYGKPALRLFIVLYNYGTDNVECWERGTTVIDHLLGFIEKYGHLNNRDYEIKRHGKKNDPKTSYQFFGEDKGPIMVEGKEIEMPERPPVYGRFVLQMEREKMLEHIQDNAPVDRKRARGAREADPFV
jgi:hypothetical protein